MKYKVENEILKIIEDETVRAESVDIYTVDVELSSEWNDLDTIAAVYTDGTNTYVREIIDNQTIIPNLKNGKYSIGIVGYNNEEDLIVKRKATNLVQKTITHSSAEYENTPGNEEVELSLIEKKIAEIESSLDVYNKTEIDTMLENYLQFEIVEEINE